jgi:hypothetical protein
MTGTSEPTDLREIETRRTIVELAQPFNILTRDETNSVRREYQVATGNANAYVPWNDPQLPYWCECGEMIYCDSPHTHPGDPGHPGYPAPAKPTREQEDMEYDVEHGLV